MTRIEEVETVAREAVSRWLQPWPGNSYELKFELGSFSQVLKLTLVPNCRSFCTVLECVVVVHVCWADQLDRTMAHDHCLEEN